MRAIRNRSPNEPPTSEPADFTLLYYRPHDRAVERGWLAFRHVPHTPIAILRGIKIYA